MLDREVIKTTSRFSADGCGLLTPSEVMGAGSRVSADGCGLFTPSEDMAARRMYIFFQAYCIISRLARFPITAATNK